VSGHILEVREALLIAWHPVPVILDGEVVCAVLLATRDRDGGRVPLLAQPGPDRCTPLGVFPDHARSPVVDCGRVMPVLKRRLWR
jgi:hypothetical protein